MDAFLAGLSARQYLEWQAMYAMEPWGDLRADLQHGIVAAATANFSGRSKRTFGAKDFMPDFGPRKARGGKEIGKLLTAMFGPGKPTR